MSIPTLKAYAVQEDCENTGGIIFAKHVVVARRLGANEFGDGDFSSYRARRAAWADQFAPGPVPVRVMFDHGWWQECHGCGCMIREDEEDDAGSVIDFDICQAGSDVYCRPSCREARLAEDEEVSRIARFVIDRLCDQLLRRMPGALIGDRTHVYVPRGARPHAPRQARIEFMFPGARHGFANYGFVEPGAKPELRVPAGDIAAFYAWREAGYPPHLMDAKEIA